MERPSIVKLNLPGPVFRNYEIQSDEDVPESGAKILDNLSKVNIFVGANNSGKSRLLREMIRSEDVSFNFGSASDAFQRAKDFLLGQIPLVFEGVNATWVGDIGRSVGNLPDNKFIKAGHPAFSAYLDFFDSLKNQDISRNLSRYLSGNQVQVRMNMLGEAVSGARGIMEGGALVLPDEIKFERYYIPVLRGVRPILEKGDPYAKRTLDDYGNFKGVAIFTGQTLYEDVTKLLLGGLNDREIVADFQEFLSRSFFNGEPVALIPKYGSGGVIDVKIGSEKEYPIHHLGDGIQSIITMTFPMFCNGDAPALFAIEEAETHLHPGLQRIFLKTLMDPRFRNSQFFLTTHSNHFLDLTLDLDNISIFSFQKSLDGEAESKERGAKVRVENVDHDDIRILEKLGVQNAAVFLSNCTIWVEGITDRRYLRRYLNLYMKHLVDEEEKNRIKSPASYKEDLHYSFVEYSGSNITHWSFLDDHDDSMRIDRLCSKFMLIADNDGSTGSKGDRHQRLRSRLGEDFILLEAKEIENTLTLEVIKKVVGKYEGEEHFKNTTVDHRSKPLGNFIESYLLVDKKRKGSYADGKTISDKNRFCEIALDNLNEFDDLSDEAKHLAKRMHAFIVSHND